MLYEEKRRLKTMNNIGDVLRQVETALCDSYFPPAHDEKEVLNNILYTVYTGAVESGGSR